MRRAIKLWLGMSCLVAHGLAFRWTKEAHAAATANVSVTILPANPVVSVLDAVPVAINSSTGSVLVHIGTSWLQVPKGADAFSVNASAAIDAAAVSGREGEGTLRDGMTVSVAASPVKAGAGGAVTSPGDTVEVLVEFN